MSFKAEKRALRKEIIALRDNLGERYREEASVKIAEKLIALPEYLAAETILVFISYGSEVSTERIVEDSWRRGKTVLAPLTIRKNRQLALKQVRSWQDFQPGAYGILEPKEDCPRHSAGEVDFVLHPGVVFDYNLDRIGYGGGYYDRLYSLLRPGIPRIAIAFDIQLVGAVPTDKYDRPVDCLITETEIYKK